MKNAYEIKGIKNFKGHEGEPCAQGSLYLGTKKVCEWSDDSWGGSMTIRFVSKKDETEFLSFARVYLTGTVDVLGRPFDLAKLDDWQISQDAVEHMSYAAAEEAEMRKLCKNKLVFKVKSKHEDGEPDVCTFNTMYTESEVSRIKALHPDILEVVNARFGKALKEGTPEHLAAETTFYSKACKTKTLYIRNVEGRRVVYSIPQPFTPVRAQQLRAKYPDLVRILNEAG